MIDTLADLDKVFINFPDAKDFMAIPSFSVESPTMIYEGRNIKFYKLPNQMLQNIPEIKFHISEYDAIVAENNITKF